MRALPYATKEITPTEPASISPSALTSFSDSRAVAVMVTNWYHR